MIDRRPAHLRGFSRGGRLPAAEGRICEAVTCRDRTYMLVSASRRRFVGDTTAFCWEQSSGRNHGVADLPRRLT